MATTKLTLSWLKLGPCFPQDGVYPHPYDKASRVAAVKDTRLSVHGQTYGPMYFQWAEYACVHARVHVELTDHSPQLDIQVLARLAVALHAWGFNCNCFRDDWKAVYGKPPSRRALDSARRWSLDFQQTQPGCWVEFAVRWPVEALRDRKAIESGRGAA
jgi:hypothetical protein